jgi:hypothetical protein
MEDENQENKEVVLYEPNPRRYFENPKEADEIISLLTDLTAFEEISQISLYPEFIKQIIDIMSGMQNAILFDQQ